MADGGNSKYAETRFVVAFEAPRRFRIEYDSDSEGHWLRVSDGEILLESRSGAGKIRRVKLPEGALRMLRSSPLAEIERLAELAERPMLVHNEMLPLGKTLVACSVIRFLHRLSLHDGGTASPCLAWVAKRSGLLLRLESQMSAMRGEGFAARRTINIRDLRVGKAVPPGTFATGAIA
jgi:hypothetical protein